MQVNFFIPVGCLITLVIMLHFAIGIFVGRWAYREAEYGQPFLAGFFGLFLGTFFLPFFFIYWVISHRNNFRNE